MEALVVNKEFMDSMEKLHIKGYNTKEISKELNVSRSTCYKYLNIMGHKFYTTNPKKYDRFNVPLTKDESWVLGVLTSDGSITRNPNGGNGFVRLHVKDKELIDKVRDIVSIFNEHELNDGFFQIASYNSEFIEKLYKLGLHENKVTTVSPPNIENIELNHYIRGLFDGDGHIGLTETKKTDHIGSIRTTYITSSRNMIEFIKNQANNLVGLSPSILTKYSEWSTNPCYTFALSGKKAFLWLSWLYKDSEDKNRLSRKYNIFKPFKQYFKINEDNEVVRRVIQNPNTSSQMYCWVNP